MRGCFAITANLVQSVNFGARKPASFALVDGAWLANQGKRGKVAGRSGPVRAHTGSPVGVVRRND